MLTVQDLLEGHGVPVTVTAETPVAEAVQLMFEHDFSQLPVVDAENRPLGLLSMDSLMRASRYFDLPISALRVSHAFDEHASRYRLDDDLSDLLDDLGNRFAVLVLDGHGALKSILTTYDAMAYFPDIPKTSFGLRTLRITSRISSALRLPKRMEGRTPTRSRAQSTPLPRRRRRF